MLFPSRKTAEMCRDFLCAQKSSLSSHVLRIVELAPRTKSNYDLHRWLDLYAVIYPAESFSTAKSFWQHTGEGISSRRAEIHRKFLNDSNLVEIGGGQTETECETKENDATNHTSLASDWMETERQIREDLRLAQSVDAKRAIRERIAKAISSDSESHGRIKTSDVYLYATGMSAIFYVHRMLLAVQGQLKSVCYGYDSGWLPKATVLISLRQYSDSGPM
jgi:cystathionine gamma-synthase